LNRCLAANPQNPKTFDHSIAAAWCDCVPVSKGGKSRACCIIVVVLSASASIIIGVAPAGAVIETRPFQLVTGRVWKGTAFGGARGRTDVPKIVDWYMDGKIEIDSLITHILPLERINEGFDLMHKGESIRAVVVY